MVNINSSSIVKKTFLPDSLPGDPQTTCNIKVTRMSLLGHDVRAVGRIKQTIQCVHKGRVQGTIHLKAKVVRDLYSILGVDCAASAVQPGLASRSSSSPISAFSRQQLISQRHLRRNLISKPVLHSLAQKRNGNEASLGMLLLYSLAPHHHACRLQRCR